MTARAWWTVSELAEHLRCSTTNVYDLMRSGRLRYVRAGVKKGYRISDAVVREFLSREPDEEPAPLKRRQVFSLGTVQHLDRERLLAGLRRRGVLVDPRDERSAR